MDIKYIVDVSDFKSALSILKKLKNSMRKDSLRYFDIDEAIFRIELNMIDLEKDTVPLGEL